MFDSPMKFVTPTSFLRTLALDCTEFRAVSKSRTSTPASASLSELAPVRRTEPVLVPVSAAVTPRASRRD
jgi:hypothetical protein